MSEHPVISWTEAGETRSARWRSERGVPPPRRVVIADDRTTADAAYHLACEGTALLWRGDFQNARQLLQALARRVDRSARSSRAPAPHSSPAELPTVSPTISTTEVFHLYRQTQSQRARTLGMLLIALADDYSVPLRRAPDARQACLEAYGPGVERSVTSLRELLGLIGAHEWRKGGIEIPALGGRIHPHYGVFAPVRSEYVGLVATVPLPAPELSLAFDIGTGTGVLAIAAARVFRRPVVACDNDPVAVATARANARANHAGALVRVVYADGTNAPAIRAGAPYDLVLANIVLGPLKLLAKPVARLLAPRATVVLSGLLPEQANAALAAWRSLGLKLTHRDTLEGWVTLTLVR